eukprot:1195621-Prorocentrum_minimum.AAC.2
MTKQLHLAHSCADAPPAASRIPSSYTRRQVLGERVCAASRALQDGGVHRTAAGGVPRGAEGGTASPLAAGHVRVAQTQAVGLG